MFPGDTPFERRVLLDMKHGHNLSLSSVTTTVHIGAHADAPSHYHRDGRGIDERELRYYLGPCEVVTVKVARGQRILVKDLPPGVPRAPRVLFRTDSYPDPKKWQGDFNSLSPELIRHLAAKGVILVGIDTPSVDPAEDKELETHQAIFENDLALLEGLVLRGVEDGEYELVAPPLKIRGADASPVRAVLMRRGGRP